MKMCGHYFSPPGQFDDPNATSATLGTLISSMFRLSRANTLLVDELKKMGFVTDFPPAKLKQGYNFLLCMLFFTSLNK